MVFVFDSVCFECGAADGRITEGVRTWAAGFRAVLWDVEWYSYLLFKDPLL